MLGVSHSCCVMVLAALALVQLLPELQGQQQAGSSTRRDGCLGQGTAAMLLQHLGTVCVAGSAASVSLVSPVIPHYPDYKHTQLLPLSVRKRW